MATAAERHTAHLAAATRRAYQLEPRLAAILRPILDAAGTEAARAFTAQTSETLLAAAYAIGDPCPYCGHLLHVGPEGDLSIVSCPLPDYGGCGTWWPTQYAADKTGDVTALSTMVAFYPQPGQAEKLAALTGADPANLHLTLCYLGETSGDLEHVTDALRTVAADHAPMTGTVAGIGQFADNGKGAPRIMLPSVPGLVEARVAVTAALHAAGIDYSRTYGYQPHLTIGYGDDDYDGIGPYDTTMVLGEPITFDAIHVVRGDTERLNVPLVGAKPLTAAAPSYHRFATAREHNDALDRRLDEMAADIARERSLSLDEAAQTLADAVTVHKPVRSLPPRVNIIEQPQTYPPMRAPFRQSFAASWSKPPKDHLVDVDALVAKLRTKTDPVRHAVIEAAMTPALADAGLSFDVTNPFTRKVLAQSASQITEISRTTQANVMAIIARAYDEGLSIPDTAKAIRGGMREASDARATLIARTELAGAVNGGSLAATQIVQEATGITFTKQWLTAPGATFPRHEDYDGLDGQETTLDGYFDVGGASLAFPGDPDGPPEEVCNCRCTLVYAEGGQELLQQDAEDAEQLDEGEVAAEAAAA